MGLDTTHDAWHGGYGSFNHWRIWLAEQFELPPLELMEGFYQREDSEHYSTNCFTWVKKALEMRPDDEKRIFYKVEKQLPIKWSVLKKDPIHTLLNHSDCDGFISWRDCGKIQKRLEWILNKIPDTSEDKSPEMDQNNRLRYLTKRFMDGCKLAFDKKEKLKFH